MDDKEQVMLILEEIRQWFTEEFYEGNCWTLKVERVIQYVNDKRE